MIINAKSGTVLAAAAATLLIAGAGMAPIAMADEGKGHCMGATACKGKGACKTASTACKGHNACKGKGFLEMTKAECGKISGATFVDPKKTNG